MQSPEPLTSLLSLTPPVDLVSAHTGLVSSAATAHKSVDILEKMKRIIDFFLKCFLFEKTNIKVFGSEKSRFQ